MNREQVIKIIAKAVKRDFASINQAAEMFGITPDMLRKILHGHAPSHGVLAYIGYKKVYIIRNYANKKKEPLEKVLKVLAAKLKAVGLADAAELLNCTQAHLKRIQSGSPPLSDKVLRFAGYYKSDEYEKV